MGANSKSDLGNFTAGIRPDLQCLLIVCDEAVILILEP